MIQRDNGDGTYSSYDAEPAPPVLPELHMGDTVRVTFTCPRWVVSALEDAIAEAVEGCEEDGDPGLQRWAEGLSAINPTVTTVDNRPDPVGKVWSMRECRYVAR